MQLVLILAALFLFPLADKIGSMAFICVIYGKDAYFRECLRAVSLRPTVLSNGETLSIHLSNLRLWMTSVVLLCMWLFVVFIVLWAFPKFQSKDN